MAIGAIDTSGVTAIIQLAAARTGVDFDYLLGQARVESGLDPDAAAPTSSARGLFQFTERTWLDMVRKHGSDAGLEWAVDALRQGADPATRTAILALRHDAGASATLAAAYAKDNGAALEQGLGRAATATDLYLAHFLGSAGALRFLQAKDADPGAAAAAAVLPAAARANAGVFTAPGGRARSLGEVYARFAAKLSPSRQSGEGPNPVTSRAAYPGFGTHLGSGLRRSNGEKDGTALPRSGNALPAAAARAAYLLLAELA